MPLKNGKEAYLLGMINKEGSGTHCSPLSPILGCEWYTHCWQREPVTDEMLITTLGT